MFDLQLSAQAVLEGGVDVRVERRSMRRLIDWFMVTVQGREPALHHHGGVHCTLW
jgi:hypothetical protein